LNPFSSDSDAIRSIPGPSVPCLLRLARAAGGAADYLPPIAFRLAGTFPNLCFQSEGWVASGDQRNGLEGGEIDLAVTMLDGELPRQGESRPLLSLPLALLVRRGPEGVRRSSCGVGGGIRERLICRQRWMRYEYSSWV